MFFVMFFVLVGLFFGLGFFGAFFEERKSILVAFLCFHVVYPCHLSCASDSDPHTTHRRNTFLGQSPPTLPQSVCRGEKAIHSLFLF